MGISLPRKKKRNLKLSLAYRLAKLIPLNSERKLKLFLDLSWIFSRLVHEQIFRTTIKPTWNETDDFLVSFISPEALVLDIGCGEGYVIKRMLNRTQNIIGVDYNTKSIEIAKEKIMNTNVTLICDDLFNYLKDNPSLQFDCIILSHVLEHIEDPGLFLNSIKNISTYFYIEVPDYEATHLNLYRQLTTGTDLIYTDIDHVSEFDRKELNKLIEQRGLRVVKCEYKFGVMKYWCER